ncbi:MAG TPA: biotin/lipoyl-binding protein, partial [Candidatus Limnocylindrales bacterium]
MRLKLVAVVVLLAVGLGAVGLVVFLPAANGGSTDYVTATASRTTVSQDVAATGTLSARSTFGLTFGAPAQLVPSTSSSSGSGSGSGAGSSSYVVAAVKVKVGDSVTKDQLLATADTSDLAVQLAIAKANLAAAQARLAADTGGPAADVR